MSEQEKVVDWIEEGRKHFRNARLHPERPPANYPTQDVHTPKDEADFVFGFKAEKGAWESGQGLCGISAYIEEFDDNRRDRDGAEGGDANAAPVPQDRQAQAEGIAQ